MTVFEGVEGFGLSLCTIQRFSMLEESTTMFVFLG